MKGLIALTAALLLLATAAHAGDGCYSSGLEGDQSIQFSIDDHFTLSSFQGQLISYQRFVSDRRALRLSAGLFLDRRNTDFAAQHDDDDAMVELVGWDTSVTIKAQFVFYEGKGPLRFIWGCGPKLTYGQYRTENASDRYEGGNVEFVLFGYESESIGVGLQGFAGVEWFINDMFSLHAEYGASAMYTYSSRFEERVETNDADAYRSYSTDSHTPSFNSDGVRFGLSAHF